MNKLQMDRVSCHVTAKCNLRCEKCAVYIPKLYELGNVPEYNIEQIKKSFQAYFEIVEYVRMISITGGEPMLYPDLADLLKFLIGFEKSYSKIEVFTNGSVNVPDDVLDVMSESDKFLLFIDNYGSDISKKVDRIESACREKNVKFSTRKYFGEDAHLGGWVDRSILPEKLNREKAMQHFSKCVVAKPGGRLFTIFGEKIAFCATPYCGYRIGMVPEEDVLLIDLASENISIEEKKEKLSLWNSIDFNPGCAWCNGLGIYNDVERFVPGKQVEKNG